MATFQGNEQPSAAASQLLHPSAAGARPGAIEVPVLSDIARGLAASVDPAIRPEGRRALDLSSAFEAELLALEPHDQFLAGGADPGADHQATAVAVVRGDVVVWTVDDGVHVLSAGASCGAGPAERVQLVNLSDEAAVLVVVRSQAPSPVADAGLRRRLLRSLVI